MRWDGISEFVYVAEYESFTRAAEEFRISTAQVSRQVNALEKQLNINCYIVQHERCHSQKKGACSTNIAVVY